MYTISDLVRKHTANKATEHYRFGQEHDESEAKSTYDAGPGTLDEESDSNQEEINQSPHAYRDTSSDADYRGINADTLLNIMHQKDAEIERLHSVIQSLNSNLEKALELNNNSQILLLNKQIASDKESKVGEAGFWGRLFRKGR